MVGGAYGGIHRTVDLSTVPSGLQRDKDVDCRGIGADPGGREGFGIRDQYTCSRMDMVMDLNKVVRPTYGQAMMRACHRGCSTKEV